MAMAWFYRISLVRTQGFERLEKSAEKLHSSDSVVQLSVRPAADLKQLAADLRGQLTADDFRQLAELLTNDPANAIAQ